MILFHFSIYCSKPAFVYILKKKRKTLKSWENFVKNVFLPSKIIRIYSWEDYKKEKMAKHHPDLIFCRKQAGVAIGRLCEKCDGRCVICDSYVRPCTLVRIQFQFILAAHFIVVNIDHYTGSLISLWYLGNS